MNRLFIISFFSLAFAGCGIQESVTGAGVGDETTDEATTGGPGNDSGDNTGGNPGAGTPPDAIPPEEAGSRVDPQSKIDVVWKRVGAMQNDLSRALSMDETALCNELGSMSCFDSVHLSPLGGNEPFELSQYVPIEEPSATTPVAVDRVVLTSCTNKVEADKLAATQNKVFTAYDLNAQSLPADAQYLATVDAQNTDLFRRFLARDPSAEELIAMQKLTSNADGQPINNADVAKISCYAIATSSEFLFF